MNRNWQLDIQCGRCLWPSAGGAQTPSSQLAGCRRIMAGGSGPPQLVLNLTRSTILV